MPLHWDTSYLKAFPTVGSTSQLKDFCRVYVSGFVLDQWPDFQHMELGRNSNSTVS